MARLHHLARGAIALALLAVAMGCRDDAYASCEGGCAGGELCWYSKNICVPEPGEGGTCPDGYALAECATGSCPGCRDCVPACIPEGMLAPG